MSKTKEILVLSPHRKPVRWDVCWTAKELARILRERGTELTKKDAEFVRGLVAAGVFGAKQLSEMLAESDTVTVTFEIVSE